MSTKLTRCEKITNLTTLNLAKGWLASAEPTMFFESEVLDVLDINLTLTNSPESYQVLQDHFEDECEALLHEDMQSQELPTLTRRP